MFAIGETAEGILILMESILSSPPKETPSVEEMFENLESFLGTTSLTRIELKNILVNLISQALRLRSKELDHDVRLVDFLKHVRRKEKRLIAEPVNGLEHWFSDDNFQHALSRAWTDSRLTKNLQNFSNSRRIIYSEMFFGAAVNRNRKAEVTLSGAKYPIPTFDINIKLHESDGLQADIFLSELLLRPPWRVAEMDAVKLDISLRELVHLSAKLLASFKLS